MFKTLQQAFLIIWKAPAGKQVIALLMILPIAVVSFYEIYYSQMRTDMAALKIELKQERTEKQIIINNYISELKTCETDKIAINNSYIKEINAYKERIEAQNKKDYEQLKIDYRAIIKNMSKANRTIDKTMRQVDNIKN